MVPNHTRYQLRYASVCIYYIFKIFFRQTILNLFDYFLYACYNTYMTIHHDKLAYGKIAANTEELSEEQILEMLKELNADEEEPAEEEKEQS